MQIVTSRDGTKIAYECKGTGPVLVLVGGAFSERAFSGWIELIDALAGQFTIINYDRRGRGDSGDTAPYTVEREIEDLEAIIDDVGGSAIVFGMSSGAVLALRAVASGLNITQLALYEPPFMLTPDSRPPADFESSLQQFINADERGKAVHHFMVKGMGAPAFFIYMMRLFPAWSRLKAVAHTLPYDIAIMGDTMSGNPSTIEQWRSIEVETVVIDGEKSPASLRNASQALAKVIPDAQYSTLEGQSHKVSMTVLASRLKEYLA